MLCDLFPETQEGDSSLNMKNEMQWDWQIEARITWYKLAKSAASQVKEVMVFGCWFSLMRLNFSIISLTCCDLFEALVFEEFVPPCGIIEAFVAYFIRLFVFR